MKDLLEGIIVVADGTIHAVLLDAKPRKLHIGEYCAVRMKDIRAGKVAEFSAPFRRVEGGYGVAVPKSMGFRVGEQVMVRMSPVDVDRWFDSDTSTPLFSSHVQEVVPE